MAEFWKITGLPFQVRSFDNPTLLRSDTFYRKRMSVCCTCFNRGVVKFETRIYSSSRISHQILFIRTITSRVLEKRISMAKIRFFEEEKFWYFILAEQKPRGIEFPHFPLWRWNYEGTVFLDDEIIPKWLIPGNRLNNRSDKKSLNLLR